MVTYPICTAYKKGVMPEIPHKQICLSTSCAKGRIAESDLLVIAQCLSKKHYSGEMYLVVPTRG